MTQKELLLAAWDYLGHVRKIHSHVEVLRPIPEVWEGTGYVNVFQDSKQIRFEERGSWKLPTQKDLSFFNKYLWEKGLLKKISLSHERLGAGHRVKLVDFIPKPNTKHLISKKPHPCADDTYDATLEIEDNSLVIRWLILGPNKQVQITNTYKS